MSHPRPVPTCERGHLRAAAISVTREASAASSVNERECVIDCARECNTDIKCERARERRKGGVRDCGFDGGGGLGLAVLQSR